MNNMINSKKLLGIALMAIPLFFTRCKKDFDTPPIKDIPVGTVLTIAEVKSMYVPAVELEITTDYSVYGVVTMDETTGNLYKEAFIQDATGGLYLRFKSSSGLYLGDSVRVNLNGATLLKYNNMFQVDNLDPDNNIVKQSTQNMKQPELTTITQIAANDSFYQGRLIQLNDVEFDCNELGLTYADAVNQTSQSRMLQDTLGIQIIVRTSGYANFSNSALPTGKGSFIGIVTQYNTDMQLLVRDPSELTLTGSRKEVCPLIFKDFSDQSVTSGGWTTQNVTGSVNWNTSDAGSTGNFYGVITNTSSQLVCETWLISPSLNLSTLTAPYVNFRSATFSANTDLQLYVSTDYTGSGSPSAATWNLLPATYSPGSWSWTNSGNVSLASYLQPNVYVAFKYNGTSSAWTTWEVDEITISE